MSGRRYNLTWMLAAGFLAACGVVFVAAPRRESPKAPVVPKTTAERVTTGKDVPSPWRVAWRVQAGERPGRPSRMLPEGWIVTGRDGTVTALSGTGTSLWRTALTNQSFEGAAAVGKELAVVASVQGDVTALRCGDGGVAWTVKADARFQHRPLAGTLAGGEPVVWLVSQADGSLFCFRSLDGGLVWKGEATNRCDGDPAVVSDGKIAYGNCDGAVYVFSGETGALAGSVAVGGSDQMAGGMLALEGGVVCAGTRQGNLVAVDVERLKLLAQVQVSVEEAFLAPVRLPDGIVAMGNREGDLSFWRLEGDTFRAEGRVSLGVPVEQLDSFGGRLFALAGGKLAVVDARDAAPTLIALGDDVYGLTARGRDSVVCVADGMVVCIERDSGK